jgi:hypothetical protein
MYKLIVRFGLVLVLEICGIIYFELLIERNKTVSLEEGDYFFLESCSDCKDFCAGIAICLLEGFNF